MKKIGAIGASAALTAALLTANPGVAKAEECLGWNDIAEVGPMIVQTATGDCAFMEEGSSTYPSHNGDLLFNLITIPISAGKWFQINFHDPFGITAFLLNSYATNTWYN